VTETTISPGPFSLDGRVAVVTGGTGAIGSALAAGLADAGARVAVVARSPDGVARTPQALEASGHEAMGIAADVLDAASLEAARDAILAQFGSIDVLVNCAGGNIAAATVPADASPFDVPIDAYRDVIDLNLIGTMLPIRVFGAAMRDSAGCSIVNVSSMAADRALTRVGGYGAAKAAVESITRWLAVELARRGTGIRVNAIAPGFIVGAQNRSLLIGDDGELTERGVTIVERTPLGRLGGPEELVSTVVWLASDGASFVTGIVVPVDGGFSAFSGV
jgi:NAD(P)-dependent dehydrogenase (short-subunit alcohol dehydrogenase family)